MKTTVLLSGYRYVEAMKSAEAKDSSINYRRLQADRSLALLYNPATRDGKFSTKLAAKSELVNGYYEAFPHIDYAQTIQENNAALSRLGWPDYRGI